MANQIDIIINAVNQTKAAFTQVKADLGGVGNNVKELQAGFGAANNEVSKLASGLRYLAEGFLLLKTNDLFKGIAGEAARVESLGTVLSVVARNAGINKESIDKVDASIQKLGITAEVSRKGLSQFVQAGLNVADASKLARAAQDLAVLSGENSSDTFRGLTQAIDETSIMMLRFRGINVTNEEAQQKYAATVGKSAASLEDWEKKQALLNLVLERSTKLSGIYEAAMGDVGKQASSLERYQTDAAVAIGNSLLPAYSNAVLELTNFLRYLKLTADAESASGDATKSIADGVKTIASSIRMGTEFLIDHKDAIIGVAKAYAAIKITSGISALAGKAKLNLMGGMVNQVDPRTGETRPVEKTGLIPSVKKLWQGEGAVPQARSAVTQTAELAAAKQHEASHAAMLATQNTLNASTLTHATLTNEIAAKKAQIVVLSTNATEIERGHALIMSREVIVEEQKLAALQAQIAEQTRLNTLASQKLATDTATLRVAMTNATAASLAGRSAPLAATGGLTAILGNLGPVVGKVTQGFMNLGKAAFGALGGLPGIIITTVGYWAIFDNGIQKTINSLNKIKYAITGNKEAMAELKAKEVREAKKDKPEIANYKAALKEQAKAEEEARQLEYQQASVVEKLKRSTNPEDIAERDRLITEIADKKKLAKEKGEAAQELADANNISKKEQTNAISVAQKEAYAGGKETDEMRRNQSLMKSREATGQMKQVFSGAMPVSMEAAAAFEGYRKEFAAYVDTLPGADASMARLMYSTDHFIHSLKSVEDVITLQSEWRDMIDNTATSLKDLDALQTAITLKKNTNPYNPETQGKQSKGFEKAKKDIEDEIKNTGKDVDTVIAERRERLQKAVETQDITAASTRKAVGKSFGMYGENKEGRDESAMLGYYEQSLRNGKITKEEDAAYEASGNGREIRLLRATQLMREFLDQQSLVIASTRKLQEETLGLTRMELAIQGLTERTKVYAKALDKVSELLQHQEMQRRKTESSGVFKAEGAGAGSIEAGRIAANAAKDYQAGMAKIAALEQRQIKEAAVKTNERLTGLPEERSSKEEEEAKKKAIDAEKLANAGKVTEAKNLAKTQEDMASYRAKLAKKGTVEYFDEAFAKEQLTKFEKANKDAATLNKDRHAQLLEDATKTEAVANKKRATSGKGTTGKLSEDDKKAAGDFATSLNNAQKLVDDKAKKAEEDGKNKLAIHFDDGKKMADVQTASETDMTAVTRIATEERIKVSQKYFDELTKALDHYKDGYIAKINAIRDIHKGLADVGTSQAQALLSAAKTAESLKFTPDAQAMGHIEALQQRETIGVGKAKYEEDIRAAKEAADAKIKLVQDSSASEAEKEAQIRNIRAAEGQDRLAKDREYFTTLSQHRDSALQKYQEYATKAKDLEKSIRDEAISDALAIREIDRTGKSDTFKYKDKKAEMREAYDMAKQLAAQGDLEGAKQQAERGKGLAKGLAGAPGVSIGQGREEAHAGYAEGAALTQGINATLAEKNKTAAAEQLAIYQEMSLAVNNMADSIKTLSTQSEIMLNPKLDEAAIAKLQEQLKNSVAEQETHIQAILADGTLQNMAKSITDYFEANPAQIKIIPVAGAAETAGVPAPLAGAVKPAKDEFAEGGKIHGIGTGTSDSIPIMASHGEFIVKQDATSHYGEGFLNLLNSKALKFAEGGVIPKFAHGGTLPEKKKPTFVGKTYSAKEKKKIEEEWEAYEKERLLKDAEASAEYARSEQLMKGSKPSSDEAIARSEAIKREITVDGPPVVTGNVGIPINPNIDSRGVEHLTYAQNVERQSAERDAYDNAPVTPALKAWREGNSKNIRVGEARQISEGEVLANRNATTPAAPPPNQALGRAMDDRAGRDEAISNSYIRDNIARSHGVFDLPDAMNRFNKNVDDKKDRDKAARAMSMKSFAEGGQPEGKWVEDGFGGQTWEKAKAPEKKSALQSLVSFFGGGKKSESTAPTIANTVNAIETRKKAMAEAAGYADGGSPDDDDSTGKKITKGYEGATGWGALKKLLPTMDSYEVDKKKVAELKAMLPTTAGVLRAIGVTNDKYPGAAKNGKQWSKDQAAGFAEGGEVDKKDDQKEKDKADVGKQISEGFKESTGLRVPEFLKNLFTPDRKQKAQKRAEIQGYDTSTIGIRGATGGEVIGGAKPEFAQQTAPKRTMQQLIEAAGKISPTYKGSEEAIARGVIREREQKSEKYNVPIGVRAAIGGLLSFKKGGIPALVSDGEYRVKPDAVSHYGAGVLSAINDMSFPKFSEGGIAGSAKDIIEKGSTGSAKEKEIMEIAFKVGDRTHMLQGSQQQAKDLAKSLKDYSMRNL